MYFTLSSCIHVQTQVINLTGPLQGRRLVTFGNLKILSVEQRSHHKNIHVLLTARIKKFGLEILKDNLF